MKIIPVILAGGHGERLWPLSQQATPKPFLFLAGARTSLFQDALLRVQDRAVFSAPLIVCNVQHVALVQEQLAAVGITDGAIIAEPLALNTAPALAFAALQASKQAAQAPMLVMPADHRTDDHKAFMDAVARGARAAVARHIATFCAPAQKPDSAYGYITYDTPVAGCEGAFHIHRFVEKPDVATAAALIAQGNTGINCGMFLMTAETALAAFTLHAPDILARCRAALITGVHRPPLMLPDAAPLAECVAQSIDYALMEKTTQAVVIPVQMGWADLGSFTTLAELANSDIGGNGMYGPALLHQCQGSYVYADGIRVAAMGLEDMLVIATPAGVLVAPKARAQELRLLQQEAQHMPLPCPSRSTAIERPWGRFYSLDCGADYQVKRLHLKPGSKISLQSHQHRSEHWVVTSGCATVTQNETVQLLRTNQSTYIPAGTIHRLENHGPDELVVIEVQTGDYLGEDDIVRLEDTYDRN